MEARTKRWGRERERLNFDWRKLGFERAWFQAEETERAREKWGKGRRRRQSSATPLGRLEMRSLEDSSKPSRRCWASFFCEIKRA